jgi:hypothetical protein
VSKKQKKNRFFLCFFERKYLDQGSDLQKKGKNWGAEANFSLFTLHFSLFFVSLHPLSHKAPDL